jgi:hypothetical protein
MEYKEYNLHFLQREICYSLKYLSIARKGRNIEYFIKYSNTFKYLAALFSKAFKFLYFFEE